jgi:hypothetical protein
MDSGGVLHDDVRLAGAKAAPGVHGARFRDLAVIVHVDDIRVLEPGDRTDLVAESSPIGFVAVFRGQDLDGDVDATLEEDMKEQSEKFRQSGSKIYQKQ